VSSSLSWRIAAFVGKVTGSPLSRAFAIVKAQAEPVGVPTPAHYRHRQTISPLGDLDEPSPDEANKFSSAVPKFRLPNVLRRQAE